MKAILSRDYRIEYLRVFATIAIVVLHSFGQPLSLFSINELGKVTSHIYNIIQLSCRWAVPCFFMITGALLLNPEKELSIKKIGKYIVHIASVILLFGTVFALMELVFAERQVSLRLAGKAFLNTLQAKSWSHLWYLYTLIALYFITPLLRYAVKGFSKGEYIFTLVVLIIGNIVIPTLNFFTGLEISKLVLLPECVLYYLAGYFILKYEDEIHIYTSVLWLLVSVSLLSNILLSSFYFYKNGARTEFLESPANILVFILSGCVFLLSRKSVEIKSGIITKTVCLLSSTGLAIYVIHPVFLNFIYKACHYIPEWGGAAFVSAITIIASISASWVLKRVPIFRKIL